MMRSTPARASRRRLPMALLDQFLDQEDRLGAAAAPDDMLTGPDDRGEIEIGCVEFGRHARVLPLRLCPAAESHNPVARGQPRGRPRAPPNHTRVFRRRRWAAIFA